MTSSTESERGPCLVCGDKSIGFNFGISTCMACKAFFRRNAVKLGDYDFVCPKNGDCPITHILRRVCSCCRLAKCFRVGMRKELILSETEKEIRRQTIEHNRQKKCAKSKTLSLIPPSSSILPVHNASFSLSVFDNAILSNIFSAYELTCLTRKSSHHSDFPSIPHSSMHSYFNEYSNTHESLIVYFKRVPEFNTISIKDKIRLLRNQFGVINNINEAIVHPGISSNLACSLYNIFGEYVTRRLLQSIERIQVFTYDPVILKLLLVVVAFSSGNYRNRNDVDTDQICDDTLTIFSAQNVYVDLLWKYILSRSPNELNAVKFFNKLIQFLLHLLDVHLLVDGYINSSPNEIEQMEPLMQSMWPKPSAT